METPILDNRRVIPHWSKNKDKELTKVHIRGDLDNNYVALTFDDGPNPYMTPKILDELKRLDVRATFFVVGRFCEQHPDIVARTLREGPTVGNHSWDHDRNTHNYLKLSQWFDMKGWRTPFYRAPWFQWEAMKGVDLGHNKPILIGCNRDTQDWTGTTGQSVMSRNIMPLDPGSIILLHDGYGNPGDPRAVEQGLKHRAQNTLDSLWRFVANIRDNGLEPVPLAMMTFDGQSLYNTE